MLAGVLAGVLGWALGRVLAGVLGRMLGGAHFVLGEDGARGTAQSPWGRAVRGRQALMRASELPDSFGSQ